MGKTTICILLNVLGLRWRTDFHAQSPKMQNNVDLCIPLLVTSHQMSFLAMKGNRLVILNGSCVTTRPSAGTSSRTAANLYKPFFWESTVPITVTYQAHVSDRVTSPHMISHSYVHPCTRMCPHSSVDPLWGQQLRRPVVFWPVVSCWADIFLCSDESLTWCLFGWATCFWDFNRCAVRRKGKARRELTEVGIRGERRSAPTWRAWTPGGGRTE